MADARPPLREFLAGVRVQFWCCIKADHRLVEWAGDLARCTEPGCGITSEDTAPWLADITAESRTLRAERDRLRAALEQIATVPALGQSLSRALDRTILTARAALGEPGA